MQTYFFLIGIGVIVILSYLFNIISQKYSVPAVLLLIVLGLGLQFGIDFYQVDLPFDLDEILKIFGKIGLIMIVLEAALDLKIKKDKLKLIGQGLLSGLVALILTSISIAMVIHFFYQPDSIVQSLIYAIPLSIMSSAIVIPSVGALAKDKKEFMIYESTFSDIFGIMFFTYLISNVDSESWTDVLTNVGLNISLTLVLSVLSGIILVYIFQNLGKGAKLILLISILIMLYGLGGVIHISSLLIILFFGLMLTNYSSVFRGKWFSKVIKSKQIMDELIEDFHLITLEAAFFVRTLFFVMFGMSIVLSTLLEWNVWIISFFIILFTFAIRFLVLRIFYQKDMKPELYITPKGLITVLLFFQIPRGEDSVFEIVDFDSGILLMTILATSLIMTYGLIRQSKKKKIADIKASYFNNEDQIHQ